MVLGVLFVKMKTVVILKMDGTETQWLLQLDDYFNSYIIKTDTYFITIFYDWLNTIYLLHIAIYVIILIQTLASS